VFEEIIVGVAVENRAATANPVSICLKILKASL
jgi:hypothetical protein